MYICFTPLLLILGTGVTTVAAGALSKSQEYKHKTHCPPFSGTFNIDQYQLYPENADFDFVQCLLYIGYASFLFYNQSSQLEQKPERLD